MLVVLPALVAVLAFPGSASAQGPPPPPGGSPYGLPGGPAFQECSVFKQNFGSNRNKFGQCVAAAARAAGNPSLTALQVCIAAGFRGRTRRGFKRSDLEACQFATLRTVNRVLRTG